MCQFTSLLTEHFDFMYEDNVLTSCMKVSCFYAKAHLVFHWCLYNKC